MLVNGIDTNKSTREKFLKRLEYLSLKSLGQIPTLDEPNQEQAEWSKNRMKSGRWNK